MSSWIQVKFSFGAPVAQKDRASASGAEGWRFNSSRAHQIRKNLTKLDSPPSKESEVSEEGVFYAQKI